MKREIKAGKVDTRTHIVHQCPQCLKESKLKVLNEFSNEEKTKTSFQVHCYECHLVGYFITDYIPPIAKPKKVK